MINITYNPNFSPGVADGEVVHEVDNILLKKPEYVVVSNQTVIDEIRLRVCKGEISHEKIIFRFENKSMQINEYGAMFNKYPKILCYNYNRITELLQCAYNKQKANKAE